MKAVAPTQNKPVIPSLFQIAPRIEDEDHAPAAISASASSMDETPFADLMLHPEKLESALKKARRENDAFDASLTFIKSPAKPATRSATKKMGSGSVGKTSDRSLVELKTKEFHFEAPFAESVKLAADFTDWEQFPLDMIKSVDGVWYTDVPLPPGQYYYRFIVDGKWCDDPHSPVRVPNPFGTVNAVANVT